MEMCLKAISAQLSDLATTISNGFFEISFMKPKKKNKTLQFNKSNPKNQ